jgi:hypothetical protein
MEHLLDEALERLEEGSFIFSSERDRWYRVVGDKNRNARDNRVAHNDVPKELKMLCLIHNITTSLKPY